MRHQFVDWNSVCYSNFASMYQEVVHRQDYVALRSELKVLFEAITWQQCEWNSIPNIGSDVWLTVRVLISNHHVGIHRDVLGQVTDYVPGLSDSSANHARSYNPGVDYLDIVNKIHNTLTRVQRVEDKLRGAIALATEELERYKDKMQDFISANRHRADEIELFADEKSVDDADASIVFHKDGSVFSFRQSLKPTQLHPSTPLLSGFKLCNGF